MKEIEKLMALRGKVEDVEKKTVDAAIDLFNDSFKLLLNDARLLIISGVKTERDYSTVWEAMSEIGKLAERFHDDELVFPVLVTNKDARLYLAKYGKEVILKQQIKRALTYLVKALLLTKIYFFGINFSCPPIYGLKATGTLTLPSSFTLFSKKAINPRGVAKTVLLSVDTK